MREKCGGVGAKAGGDEHGVNDQREEDVRCCQGNNEDVGGADLLWPQHHDGNHHQVGEEADQHWGENVCLTPSDPSLPMVRR